MSDQSNDFCTPPELVAPIKEFFEGTIDLDPCSNKFSTVGAVTQWCLPTNSLKRRWKVTKGLTKAFVNPPYAPYYLSDDGATCLSPQQYKKFYHSPSGFTRYTIMD